ncbi:MAG TPA: Gfo/Idh/MocA family oxidoreductase [Gemmatimonadaceae bacterium]|nr:Gfo/Idh/MocA family oxidoreductase [Gemmatimonadaceae bacterium]
MNGVTGRMGRNQHLARSVIAIRDQGGVKLSNGDVVVPDPILVGRSAERLRELAEEHGIERWSTDLDTCLKDPADEIYFDAQVTSARAPALAKAIDAGKHVYSEKPVANDLATALELATAARAAGVSSGVVQDKLFLPGLRKLKGVIDSGLLGRLVAVRGEFGYWVFEGDWRASQRPSWNYRKEDGGGIILDMFTHWRYVLDHLFGEVRSVYCQAATHIATRYDEDGQAYPATADDAAYAIFELEDGVIAQINSSWCVRVYRDELVEFQVDGTEGSAVAGLNECRTQHRMATPRPLWNPDLPPTEDFRAQWQEVPDDGGYDNGFKNQWEMFLRHVAGGEPFEWDLFEAAKGVQLAELAYQSWREGRRIDVPPLSGAPTV